MCGGEEEGSANVTHLGSTVFVFDVFRDTSFARRRRRHDRRSAISKRVLLRSRTRLRAGRLAGLARARYAFSRSSAIKTTTTTTYPRPCCVRSAVVAIAHRYAPRVTWGGFLCGGTRRDARKSKISTRIKRVFPIKVSLVIVVVMYSVHDRCRRAVCSPVASSTTSSAAAAAAAVPAAFIIISRVIIAEWSAVIIRESPTERDERKLCGIRSDSVADLWRVGRALVVA